LGHKGEEGRNTFLLHGIPDRKEYIHSSSMNTNNLLRANSYGFWDVNKSPSGKIGREETFVRRIQVNSMKRNGRVNCAGTRPKNLSAPVEEEGENIQKNSSSKIMIWLRQFNISE